MRVLLDTHALLWWFDDAARLSSRARTIIAQTDNEVVVSAASAWEIAIKTKAGKLQAESLFERLPAALRDEGFLELPVTLDHAVRAGLLVEYHRDPFDRMLVAQAQAENLAILSNDPAFDDYGVRRIW